MTPEQRQIIKQEAEDERNAPKIDAAYERSLTSTMPAPKKAPVKIEKKAKGGTVRGWGAARGAKKAKIC